MRHHVHCAYAEHCAIHIVAVEHVVHIMILLDAVEEYLLPTALLEVFSRRDEETRCAAGGIADDLLRLGIHELHHHFDYVAGRAELTVEAGLRDLGEQILIGIAADVGGLRLAHERVDAVERIDDL